MKKMLFVLGLLLAFNAKAEAWVMMNEAGGEITLTDRVCEENGRVYEGLRRVYSWSNKVYIEGCWGVVDGNVHVIWKVGNGTQKNVYNINQFRKKQ